jgi:tRNA A37 methylthiotransferase MiaB
VALPGGRAAAMNVQLSADETYADIVPVRQHDRLSAYVSIMRGCNNSERRSCC